jgi:hypothetical protein
MRYDNDGAPTGLLDVVSEGLGDLPGALQKPRIMALTETYLRQVQALENATWGVFIGRPLRDAKGAALDQWGRLVEEPRNSEGDTAYLVRILVKLAVNRSKGRFRDLRGIALLAIGHDAFAFWAHRKAIILYVYEPVSTSATGAQLRAWFRLAKVCCESFALARTPSTPALIVSSKSDPIPATGYGIASKVNPSVGGKASGVF